MDQARRLMAALQFRSGRFQQAADLFDQYPKGPAWPAFQFQAAMAHHKLGSHDQANKLFDETNDWVKQQQDAKEEGPAVPTGQSWHHWTIYKSLQREAESLINGKTEPKPAGGDAESSPAGPSKLPPPDKPSGAPSKSAPNEDSN